ncbi:hypothetical protein L1887_52860 [Cichorium endivia]|nr:hypothetical protein L1887_52860 [Cichorium endivia]
MSGITARTEPPELSVVPRAESGRAEPPSLDVAASCEHAGLAHTLQAIARVKRTRTSLGCLFARQAPAWIVQLPGGAAQHRDFRSLCPPDAAVCQPDLFPAALDHEGEPGSGSKAFVAGCGVASVKLHLKFARFRRGPALPLSRQPTRIWTRRQEGRPRFELQNLLDPPPPPQPKSEGKIHFRRSSS